MIENQIFRPWQSMVKLESNETFYKDDRSIDSASLTKLTDLNDNKSINKSNKLITDADFLKRKLANELRKTEKIKESTKIDQKSNGIQHNNQTNKINTPASSSAETRLINSRIAALSSASHLMNLENLSRLNTPINNQIAVAAATHAALVSVNSITPNSIPLNFILPPSNNLQSIPINNMPNNLPEINSTNFQNFNPLPIHQPKNILPQQPTLATLNNSLPISHQLISNHQLPIPPTIPIPNTSIPLNTNQWPELVNSVSIQPQQLNIQQTNLINTQPCLPSSSLVESSHFSTIITNPSDILMAKKSQTIKKNRIKKFHCDVCGQGFANNGQLKGHKRSHTGKLT